MSTVHIEGGEKPYLSRLSLDGQDISKTCTGYTLSHTAGNVPRLVVNHVAVVSVRHVVDAAHEYEAYLVPAGSVDDPVALARALRTLADSYDPS